MPLFSCPTSGQAQGALHPTSGGLHAAIYGYRELVSRTALAAGEAFLKTGG
ncbi:MAG: hypothetical protein ABL888_09155 [Pirellulaceae bacterium]